MKPLAIDLFCGLGGWTEGLQAEGYSYYAWICHTKRVLSRIDSGRRSTSQVSVGFGRPVSSSLVTVSLSSRKAILLAWRIASHMSLRSAKSLTGCRCCIAAITHRVCAHRTSSSAPKKTTFAIVGIKAGGSERSIETNGERKIRVPFSAMRPWSQCWLSSPQAEGR